MYGFQMESGVVAEFGGFSPLKSGGGAAGKRTFHSRERGNLYASLCDANYRRFATQTDSRVRGNGMRGRRNSAKNAKFREKPPVIPANAGIHYRRLILEFPRVFS